MHGPFAEFALLLLICALAGAAFVRLRQPVLIAYIVVGIAVGPAGFGLVTAHDQIDLLAQVHETGAALTLMHVLPGGALQELRQWLGTGHAMEQLLHDDAQRQLGALVSQLQTHCHVTARAVKASGSVLDEINREAEVLDAALLVLGARGAGFLRRLVLGTTSERLLQLTVRPLLVVRQPPHEHYRRVLVALDFSPWSARAITLARRVAPHARLLLFNAYEVPFGEKLRFAGVDAATIDLLLGSVSKHVLAEGSADVLVSTALAE